MVPTPENYRKIYVEIAGSAWIGGDDAEDRKLRETLRELARQASSHPTTELVERALKSKDWESARSALVGLLDLVRSARQTDGSQKPGEHAGTELSITLRTLMTEWDRNQAGWTRARKRTALEQALAAGAQDPRTLHARLRSLARQWREASEQGGAALVEEAAASGTSQPPDSPILPQLRECMAFALDVAVPRLLKHAPGLVWESRALAARARQIMDTQAVRGFNEDLRQFADRLEATAAPGGDMQEPLLRLLRLLVDNMHDLLSADVWIQGQIAIVRDVLAKPLCPDVIDEAERAIRDLMLKQGALKQSIAAARDTLKALVHGFIERLAELSRSTGSYQDKLEVYAARIQATDDIGSLDDLLQELLADTREMHQSTDETRRELESAKARVEQAELRIREMERELERLSERVREDQLTGTLNRCGLADVFSREAGRADRMAEGMCVALLDIDNFKQLNDRFGHQAGDAALMHLVDVIKAGLRPQDAVARYGGEEFVLLLPGTEPATAEAILTRLQRELTRRFFLHNNDRLLITFSCGVAERRPGEVLDAVLARADRALYRAKSAGKNRVFLAEPA